MNLEQESVVSNVRKEWDTLAQKNAFHYIASLRETWPEDEFLLSGESDVAELVDPYLSDARFEAQDKKMLEIGCGVGRMSFAFAKRFARVDAVDISSEMIRRAEDMQRNLGVANVRFRVGSGKDLAEFLSDSMDFCFSYIVFQHIPSVSVILGYVREIGRVLKPNGLFRIQVNGYRRIRFPRGYYLLWGTCPTHRLRKYKINTRPHIRFGKLDGWRGVPITVSEIEEACSASGLKCTGVMGVGKQFMWVSGKKIAGAS